VTVSRSRPQRSQNWVPRSTVHSTPAQSPGGCATHSTIGPADGGGARWWYRDGAAFVSFGAGRHRTGPVAPNRAGHRHAAPSRAHVAMRSTLAP
jgi:hypothetical protein